MKTKKYCNLCEVFEVVMIVLDVYNINCKAMSYNGREEYYA